MNLNKPVKRKVLLDSRVIITTAAEINQPSAIKGQKTRAVVLISTLLFYEVRACTSGHADVYKPTVFWLVCIIIMTLVGCVLVVSIVDSVIVAF